MAEQSSLQIQAQPEPKKRDLITKQESLQT